MMKNGFTLIELLVSVTIMLLMVGGGIVAYLQFNDRQVIQTSGKEVVTYLRTAQTKARVGDKPATCNRLLGYAFKATAGTSQVRVGAVCDNGEPTPDTYDLADSVDFSGTVDMEFGVLHGGVANSGTITLTNGTLQYQIKVSQGGEISNGELFEFGGL